MDSVYDLHAPKLAEFGYYPLSIMPGAKFPGHNVPSLGEFEKTSGWQHPRRPIDTSPQPGAGIGLRCGRQPDGTNVVALDVDRDDLALAFLDIFRATVMKEGQRGLTAFFRSSQPISSHDFKINGCVAIQVLSDGRQTVLPPSIHPDIRRPYTWSSKFDLYSVKPADLPELPADYVERIEAILAPFGYQPEPAKPERPKQTAAPTTRRAARSKS